MDFPPLKVGVAHEPLPARPPSVWDKRSTGKAGTSRPDVEGVSGAPATGNTLAQCAGPRSNGDRKLVERINLLEGVVLSAFAAAGQSKETAKSNPIWFDVQRGDAAELKKRSAVHRSKWILGSGSRLDAQLSYIGRALPPAPRESVHAALKQHKEDLTSVFVTDPEVLDRCRDFVERWARKKMVAAKAPLGEPSWPSTSSCYERSAGKGGALRHLLSGHAYDDLPIEIPLDQTGAQAALELRFVQHALRQMNETEVPRHRVTCLSERGLKTRVVSVGPAWCQILGHAVRKRLLKGLRATPGTHQPLVGAKDEELFERFLGGFSETCVSTDLTRATDLLPFDLLTAVVDGLAKSGKLSLLEIKILRTLSGPQDLEYSDGTIRSSRGTLMGLPTSWCLLSLIHLYWLDEVKRTSKPSERHRHRFSICGDDALLATTLLGARAYRNIVSMCGGVPSAGKHYECDTGIVRRGVFLEKLLEFSVLRDGLGPGLRFPAIPVKGLTSRNLPRLFTEGDLVSCRSFGIRQILVLDALAQDSKALMVPLKNYINTRVQWLAAYARDVLGLSPGHPLSRGGYLFSKRTADGDAEAVFVRDSGRSFSMAVRRELDPSWRLASQFSREGKKLSIELGELVEFPPYAASSPMGFETYPPDPEGWVVVTDESREMATTVGMFAQISAFSERKNEVYTLRAQDFVKKLRVLRDLGRSRPSGLDLDVHLGPNLIAWRLPHVGDENYGTSWLTDLDNNRRLTFQAGLALLSYF